MLATKLSFYLLTELSHPAALQPAAAFRCVISAKNGPLTREMVAVIGKCALTVGTSFLIRFRRLISSLSLPVYELKCALCALSLDNYFLKRRRKQQAILTVRQNVKRTSRAGDLLCFNSNFIYIINNCAAVKCITNTHKCADVVQF